MLEINGWFMEQYEEDNSTKTNNPISGYIFSVAYKIMVRKGKKNKKKNTRTEKINPPYVNLTHSEYCGNQ